MYVAGVEATTQACIILGTGEKKSETATQPTIEKASRRQATQQPAVHIHLTGPDLDTKPPRHRSVPNRSKQCFSSNNTNTKGMCRFWEGKEKKENIAPREFRVQSRQPTWGGLRPRTRHKNHSQKRGPQPTSHANANAKTVTQLLHTHTHTHQDRSCF